MFAANDWKPFQSCLFEYFRPFIRLFILFNKLPILAQNLQKKSKLGRNNRISYFSVDLHSIKVTKLQFFMVFLVNILEQLPESRQF
jgi:hypothetical protein